MWQETDPEHTAMQVNDSVIFPRNIAPADDLLPADTTNNGLPRPM
jgi:hypothetical protein